MYHIFNLYTRVQNFFFRITLIIACSIEPMKIFKGNLRLALTMPWCGQIGCNLEPVSPSLRFEHHPGQRFFFNENIRRAFDWPRTHPDSSKTEGARVFFREFEIFFIVFQHNFHRYVLFSKFSIIFNLKIEPKKFILVSLKGIAFLTFMPEFGTFFTK